MAGLGLSQSATFLLCVCLFLCLFLCFFPVNWTVSLSLAFFFFRSRPLIVRSDVFISSRIGYFLLQPYTHTENWPANLSTKEQFTSWLHVSYVDGKCAAHIRIIHSWLLLMQVNWATRLRNLDWNHSSPWHTLFFNNGTDLKGKIRWSLIDKQYINICLELDRLWSDIYNRLDLQFLNKMWAVFDVDEYYRKYYT